MSKSISRNWVSVQNICRILCWQAFDLMKEDKPLAVKSGKIQNWG
jgi:hypothetical protein